MKIKTSDLIGPALDWAVAKCEGVKDHWPIWQDGYYCQPSTDWAQGGPIIEREKIQLIPREHDEWDAYIDRRLLMDNVTAAQSELEAALKQRDELLVALCRVIATHDYHAAKAKAESDFARAIIAKVTGERGERNGRL